ncbi:MAG: rfaF, partial [Verrucomicrobiaceae bacterium]|nr:rfaF [Verrucomicrobiaceae bacterium]
QVSTKQWPLASFVTLGKELQARGWQVAYLGGAGDLGALLLPEGALNLLGKTTVPEAAAVLARAAALCGNDSGLFHLAQALDCPALGIFGSTSPRFTGPFRPKAATAVLQAAVPCAGCYLHECAPPAEVLALGLDRPCCMHAVTVTQAVHELEAVARHVSPSVHP